MNYAVLPVGKHIALHGWEMYALVHSVVIQMVQVMKFVVQEIIRALEWMKMGM